MMNLTACVGLGGTTSSLGASIINRARPRRHFNVTDQFFEGKNYRLVLECLDGGYDVAMNLIRSMKSYRDLRMNYAGALTSHSNQVIAQLQQQSLLSCYHTTKRAQMQTAQSFNEQAVVIRSACDQIQQVIEEYRGQIDRMYPKSRFGVHHKHYRTKNLERLFKNAYASLHRVLTKLATLHVEKKNACDALRKAKIEYENLLHDPAVTKSQLKRANEKKELKENDLSTIEADIIEGEEERDEKKIVYRKQAMEILVQCRELEEERLNQIKQTLIQFNQAVHSRDFSVQLDNIYEQLLGNIVDEQNTTTDIQFWTQTYVFGNSTKSDDDSARLTTESSASNREKQRSDQEDSSTDDE